MASNTFAMALTLTALLSLAGIALSAPLATPQCFDSVAKFTASATNFNPATNASIPVSGSFGIQIRYCEPTVKVAARENTVQVLVHGITYNTEYWDSSFQPDTYSYVRFAAAQGYATLNMARLGDGKSDRPDPVTVVQAPLEFAILQAMIKSARAGTIPGATRGFGTVVAVGHSFGSFVVNGAIASEPDLVDAVILTGYGHDLSNAGSIVGILGLGPARDIDPARFGSLPADYMTTLNASNRAAGFYGAAGTFDPAALAFDEAHKDTATTGEFLALAGAVPPAPQFTGDVFTINGVDDIIFCTLPRCANIASEGQYYPKAKSVESAVVPAVGHSLNFHLTAPAFYATLQTWLTARGY